MHDWLAKWWHIRLTIVAKTFIVKSVLSICNLFTFFQKILYLYHLLTLVIGCQISQENNWGMSIIETENAMMLFWILYWFVDGRTCHYVVFSLFAKWRTHPNSQLFWPHLEIFFDIHQTCNEFIFEVYLFCPWSCKMLVTLFIKERFLKV